MSVLFITLHNPCGNGGGAIASYSYIKVLSEIFEDNFDLCMASECYIKGKLDELRLNNLFLVSRRNVIFKLIGFIFGVMHRYYFFVKRMKNIKKYDYVVFDKSIIGGSLVKYFNRHNIKTITIHHNFEREYYKAEYKNGLKYFLLRHNIIKNEKKAFKYSNFNFFLTESDKKIFEQTYGNNEGINCVTGLFFISENPYNINTNIEKKFDFIISCSLSAQQNIKAIESFINKYYSIIEDKKLLICGRNPHNSTKQILERHRNITLVANPNDGELNELIQSSRFYICPIEDGGGIKVRCFDAIKGLLPVIVHKNSLRGYEQLVKEGFFYPYQDELSLKESVMGLDAMQKLDYQFFDRYKKCTTALFGFNEAKQRINNFLI